MKKKERQRKQKARQTTAIPNLITILLSYIIISIEIRRKKIYQAQIKVFVVVFGASMGQHSIVHTKLPVVYLEYHDLKMGFLVLK